MPTAFLFVFKTCNFLFQGPDLDLESHEFMLCSYSRGCYRLHSVSFATTGSSNTSHTAEGSRP